ncbi:OLC1v1034624C2 [Oldenlandia corymbosa var. corymbosa]|uniref:OLC1v1034624C2 n=1 Tax=Oldenlandia corymbosa var. corymbosa TaxID=529605 RepID=A0AAV1CSB4_OLDCO|nr:OLC1v1034624C2 [Oldenlandia corymbosa var. corymbosa]
MWQVLLAAAAAGSGILAKKLIIDHNAPKPISSSKQDDHVNEKTSSSPKDSIFTCKEGCPDDQNEAEDEIMGDGSIFMFSSTPSSSEKGSKSSKKKMAGGTKGNVEGLKRNDKGEEEKKCGVMGCGKQGWVVDQRKSGKRLYIYPKKRRTSKNIAGKCQSCASKGNSPFTWGLSVGMMYMMSAGKAEISKLYNSMDETAQIVQELKAELSRRKILQNQFESAGAHANVTELNSQNVDAFEIYGHPKVEEGECASSVLTEDRQIDPLGMDQLEAELEQELEKLPWSCGIEGRKDKFEVIMVPGIF